jgi:short-subunit dehydrogenase
MSPIDPADLAPEDGDLSAKDLNRSARPFAIVTGASSGIGLELARQCAAHGFDLLVAADEREIADVARELEGFDVEVVAVLADLSTAEGVDKMLAAASNRPIDALLANAGRGLGKGFLDQDWNDIGRVIDTNVTGTVYLLHKVGREMRDRGHGRILITGSIAGFMPGTYQAVYNGTKAFLDLFSYALRAELADRGVSVTCLMPGATETEFFERADMLDTKVGTEKKADAREVAEAGFKAMMDGEGGVVAGWQNKLQAAIARVAPKALMAKIHAGMAAPGTAGR